MSDWFQQLLSAVSLDSYNLKARWLPALIVLSPLLVALAIPLSLFAVTIPNGSLGAGLIVAGMYLASQGVRAAGVSTQSGLWKNWGGPPSTRFMRWNDRQFSTETKELAHQMVADRFGIHLLTPIQERDSPESADRKIEQAFMQVRQILRTEADGDRVLQTHNAEYGFLRNLVGARGWTLGLASVCLVASAVSCWSSPRPVAVVVCTVEMLLAAGSVLAGWYILPNILEHSANRYAESAWSCFLQLPSNRQIKPKV